MGYTTKATNLSIGLGVSSISDLGGAFAQNDKTIAGYYKAIAAGTLAIEKGVFLTEEDKAFRRHILNIICRGATRFEAEWLPVIKEWVMPSLEGLREDGLVQ
jgi:oxygen-independent coproporphyrinogen-3 oxidase